MLDIKDIRQAPEMIAGMLRRRGFDAPVQDLLARDAELREAITARDGKRTLANEASRRYGAAKTRGSHSEMVAIQREADAHNREIPTLNARVEECERALTDLLMTLPNLPGFNVPDGAGSADNVLVRESGKKRKIAKPRDHVVIAEGLGLLDVPAGVALAGSRFSVLRGDLAKLSRALGQFMLDHHVDRGFEEIEPPFLVEPGALFGTGQLPKFRDDLFAVLNGGQVLSDGAGRVTGVAGGGSMHYLIPTGEVPLTNLHRGEILGAGDLPCYYTALTPCFRAEAGSAGRDTRGLIRQHQFMKCELVGIVPPESESRALARLLDGATSLLDALELPYRVMNLCAGDLGFSAAQTFDVEVWLPSENTYREISSVSSCGDFQARRMNTRYRDTQGKPQFVHTLNGSGLAVGRTLVAILENYQQPDGGVEIPAALRPYMGNRERLIPRQPGPDVTRAA